MKSTNCDANWDTFSFIFCPLVISSTSSVHVFSWRWKNKLPDPSGNDLRFQRPPLDLIWASWTHLNCLILWSINVKVLMCPVTSEIPKSIYYVWWFPDFSHLSDKSYVKLKMSMDHWWNDTHGRKPKYLEINLSQWHFVHHKSHIDWPEVEPLEASNYPPGQWYDPLKHCWFIFCLWICKQSLAGIFPDIKVLWGGVTGECLASVTTGCWIL